MVAIVLTQQAIDDINDIATYIANDSAHYAALQVQKFLNKVQILEHFPLAGRVVAEIRWKTIRELIEGNYRIIYKVVSKESIHILAVHHSKRRLRASRFIK
jgi:toxin ParE1/3/4